MTEQAASRPGVTFRIGVTGTRTLTYPGLSIDIADLLTHIKQEVQRAAAATDHLFPGQDTAAAANLHFISPLAEGSDRIAAAAALQVGLNLHAPIPFLQNEYENDFPNTVEEFRDLWNHARKLELDGARAFADQAYREAGRFVVRNCDLLIAVWDGEIEKGVGGTAEIVRFALNAKVPVWWIHSAGGRGGRFITRQSQCRVADADAFDDNLSKLKRYVRESIEVPNFDESESTGVFGRFASAWRRRLTPTHSPLAGYLSERRLPDNPLWRTYDVFMTLCQPKRPAAEDPSPSVENGLDGEIQRWWKARYEFADELSVSYGRRYRSSYMLIALLACLALCLSALASFVPHWTELVFAGIEALAVAGIALFVLANLLFGWHEKWVAYRLLAELCRKQALLALLGRSLPIAEITRFTNESLVTEQADTLKACMPRDAWVAWYFGALSREAPLLTGSIHNETRSLFKAMKAFIVEQIAYHRARAEKNNAANRMLGYLGEGFFIATAGVTAIKFYAMLNHHDTALVWPIAIGSCLSAASAAFVGIKAYSEFSLLARQSVHMIALLEEIMAELDDLGASQSLQSAEVGRVAQLLAVSMLQDVNGWMQLFRVKSIEAG